MKISNPDRNLMILSCPKFERLISLFANLQVGSVLYKKTNAATVKHCVVPKIIHTTPTEGHWKFLGGGGN